MFLLGHLWDGLGVVYVWLFAADLLLFLKGYKDLFIARSDLPSSTSHEVASIL